MKKYKVLSDMKEALPSWEEFLNNWFIHDRNCDVSYKSGLQVCNRNCREVFNGLIRQTIKTERAEAVIEERERIVKRIGEIGRNAVVDELLNNYKK